MTNLLTRIKNVIMADLYEAVDQKEKQNPIALLNQYLRQCEQETEKVRKLLERQYTLKDELTREHLYAVESANKRKYQAGIASEAGEKELFEFVSAEHGQYLDRAQRLSSALEQISSQLEELERKYTEMKHKVKDMHIRRMELMGRENIARATNTINNAFTSGQITDHPFSRFKEIEHYLDHLELQVKSSHYRSTIDARIAELEKSAKLEESKSIS